MREDGKKRVGGEEDEGEGGGCRKKERGAGSEIQMVKDDEI